MKSNLKFIMTIFSMALLLTVGVHATAKDNQAKPDVNQAEYVTPAATQVVSIESYKLDDAEYKSVVATKFSTNGIQATAFAAAIVGIFAMLGSFFSKFKTAITWRNAFMFALAAACVGYYFMVPASEMVLATAAVPLAGVDLVARIKKLKEDRAAEFTKIEAINSKAEAENRARTAEEKNQWKTHQDKITELDEEIRDLEKLSEQRAQAAKGKGVNILSSENRGDNMHKVAKRYSVHKALRESLTSDGLTGLESEMDQEAVKESRGFERDNSKAGFSIPSSLFALGKQQRDLLISTEGADVMQPEFADTIIPILAPKPVVVGLGASTLTGLTGDFKYRRHNGAASMTWQGEGTALTETTPTFDKVELTPQSLGGFIEVSDKFFLQAGFGVEAWVRGELNRAFGLKLDLTALSGAGSGSEPAGIANIAGINTVSFGSPDGGAPTWAKILEFISDIETSNAEEDKLAFLTTFAAKSKLMSTPKQSSGVEGNFLLNDPKMLAGYKFVASNQCRSNLVEGGSGATLSEVFFGNWSELFIGQFGAINILINPYLKSRERLVSIEISSHFDIDVAHAQSFSYSADMVTT